MKETIKLQPPTAETPATNVSAKTDGAILELLPIEQPNSYSSLLPFSFMQNTQPVPELKDEAAPRAIIEAEDGVFCIAQNLPASSENINADFMHLVNSVLK